MRLGNAVDREKVKVCQLAISEMYKENGCFLVGGPGLALCPFQRNVYCYSWPPHRRMSANETDIIRARTKRRRVTVCKYKEIGLVRWHFIGAKL